MTVIPTESLMSDVMVLRQYFMAYFPGETPMRDTLAVKAGNYVCHFKEDVSRRGRFFIRVMVTNGLPVVGQKIIVSEDIAPADLSARIGDAAEQLIKDYHQALWGVLV